MRYPIGGEEKTFSLESDEAPIEFSELTRLYYGVPYWNPSTSDSLSYNFKRPFQLLVDCSTRRRLFCNVIFSKSELENLVTQCVTNLSTVLMGPDQLRWFI